MSVVPNVSPASEADIGLKPPTQRSVARSHSRSLLVEPAQSWRATPHPNACTTPKIRPGTVPHMDAR